MAAHQAATGATLVKMDAATKELLELMFAPEGNYVQELIIEEAVRAVDSLSRTLPSFLFKRDIALSSTKHTDPPPLAAD
eukprot:2954831-Pyramimonas_sp.AAC.1